MPATTNIGGFYASLGLNPDKASFESGMKLISGTANEFNKLIGAARNAAVVLAMDKIGASESQLGRTATKIGVTTEAMNLWSTAAKIAGLSADGVIASMSKLGDVLNQAKYKPELVTSLSNDLAKLKIQYKDIKDLSADNAMLYILERAQATVKAGEDLTSVAWKVNDILGEGGQDIFLEIMKRGMSPREFLAGASNKIFTNGEDNKAADKFYQEWSEMKTTFVNIGKALGIEGEKILTPYIKEINDWIDEHGDEIEKAIKAIGQTASEVIGVGVKTVGDWWKTHGDEITDKLSMLVAQVASIFGWITSESGKGFFGGIKNINKVAFGTSWEMIKALFTGYGYEIPNIIQQGFSDMWDAVTETAGAITGSTNDGIIRPDGSIVQVAPDDWVFAARDVGNMARAFVPQGTVQGAPNEYIINQTFNVSGSNDIPQVIKQQAYRGAQEGLQNIMAQSSQRLQLMSGTR